MRDYLHSATDETGQPFFRWAVLTNGGVWRLYCRDAHPSAYFQFNLGDRPPSFCSYENFKVFLALFQAAVFVPRNGVCALDEVRTEAIQYQTELEGNLRKRVFTVLVDLANGFWSYPGNNLTTEDLPALYDNCLIFLYRVLFVFYAESRGLLPVRPSGPGSNRNYRERYSLQRLAPLLKRPGHYQSDDFTKLYEELLELFHLINGDQPARNRACAVPRYNGGLFNYKEHPRLEQWRIGEKSLASVLRNLIFSGVPAGRKGQTEFDWGTIDYADLEVRQLGDIYEGLLGGHLELENGRLALRGERAALQATGTFYTPDFIVRYLVHEALKPLIDEIEATETVQAAKKTGKKDNSFALAVLKLNILDPAMGSGHFLVRATEWLADQIVYHPTTEFQIKTVPPGLSQEQAEIAYWRRRVVESCIYGVDYNPLAVELAKLSLWLTCISTDEPLSFLDHHLRPGNSLIGARLSELGALPRDDGKQVPLAFGPDLGSAVGAAIRSIAAIEGETSSDLETLKRKESRWHDEVLPRLEPYKKVSDLWTATLTGLKLTESTYLRLAEGLTKPPKPRTGEAKRFQKELDEVQPDLDRVTDTVRMFHWELEFPDVFFDEDGSPKTSPGFDAILGNPPYISTQTSSDLAYRKALQDRFGFVDDLYVHFVFRGFELLRKGGCFGFIISDTFFTLGTKQRLRELLQGHRLTHLGQCDPFAATVDAAIFVARKLEGTPQDEMLFVQARYGTETSKPEIEILNLLKGLPGFTPGVTPFVCDGKRFPVRHAVQGCLRLHQTAVEPYRRALKRAFFEPTETVVYLHNRLMGPMTQLVEEWWDRIETSKKFAQNREAILAHQRTLKPGDVTLIGLIAEGGQGLATANNMRFLGYLDGTKQGEGVRARRHELKERWESHPKVGPVFRELLKENAGDFEAVVEPLKEKFDPTRDLGLKKTDIYRIVPRDRVAEPDEWNEAKRREVIYDGLDGKRLWVPFRKGDPEGNKWLDSEPLFICWTKENVKYLSTSPDARWQGHEFFFQPGVTWTRGANHTSIKTRLQPACVFDVNAMRLTPLLQELLPADVLLAIFNSDLLSFICKKFIAHTWMVQINDIRQVPIVVPSHAQARELKMLAQRALEAKKLAFEDGEPSADLIAFCRRLATEQQAAPPYLGPSSQLHLLHIAEDCLTAIELAVHWAVERLYGTEGFGPFNEF